MKVRREWCEVAAGAGCKVAASNNTYLFQQEVNLYCVCVRSRHCLRGVSRGPDPTTPLSLLGHHLLPHVADSWPGHHGNCQSLSVFFTLTKYFDRLSFTGWTLSVKGKFSMSTSYLSPSLPPLRPSWLPCRTSSPSTWGSISHSSPWSAASASSSWASRWSRRCRDNQLLSQSIDKWIFQIFKKHTSKVISKLTQNNGILRLFNQYKYLDV